MARIDSHLVNWLPMFIHHHWNYLEHAQLFGLRQILRLRNGWYVWFFISKRHNVNSVSVYHLGIKTPSLSARNSTWAIHLCSSQKLTCNAQQRGSLGSSCEISRMSWKTFLPRWSRLETIFKYSRREVSSAGENVCIPLLQAPLKRCQMTL